MEIRKRENVVNTLFWCLIISVIIIVFPITLCSSQYQFLFHHYNDISSYSQNFTLPPYKESSFYFGINATQDASKNITLSKNNENSIVTFNVGAQPLNYLKFNLREKIMSNQIVTEGIESKVRKNEFLFETIYSPTNWLQITPYYLTLSDHYKRKLQGSVDIANPGNEKGIKGAFDIKNIGSIESEIGIRDQSISNEKRGIIDASFEKPFSIIRIGGNIEGKNLLTQYPIVNGKEEKFLESARGNIYSEFPLFNRLNTTITYNGSFKNEIYTLLEGYSEKHNNEKRTFNAITSTVSYPLNSKIFFDVNMEGYKGKKLYQDGLNDELSTVKTFIPSLTFRPNKRSEIKIKRILRLSSFTFPNPLTVTDRDILDKSVLLMVRYNFPKGTSVALTLGRAENHIIYIRSKMSANNVCRIKYNIDTNINYFIPHRIKFDETFSLAANYQIYDFPSQRNLFTRSFAHRAKLYILNLHPVKPLIKYKFLKQDWGPYLFSYDERDYIYYRNIENRKESYEMDVEIEPWPSFLLIPSYTFNRNRFKTISAVSNQSKSSLIEEHYSLGFRYESEEGKLINIDFIWIKRSTSNNFYELKAEIAYGV